MRSSTTFLAAASILSLAVASPLERRYYDCTAPQVWHVCWDGWEGCCSVTPCKGPAEGMRSFCADDGAPPPSPVTPPTETATPVEAPTSACSPESTSPPAASPTVDTDWMVMDDCKEDDSNCNWAPTFFGLRTDNETFAETRTNQFYIRKDAGVDGARRDSIAVFTGIPDTVTKCSIRWCVSLQSNMHIFANNV
jgi:hypothetical protein